jgi:hypothetical protein
VAWCYVFFNGASCPCTELGASARRRGQDQERIKKYQEYLKQREAEEKAILEKPITAKELETKNLVEVEPNNILPSDLVSTYSLVPYRVRRPRWGHLFAVTYSLYEPSNYQSDFSVGDFTNLYGAANTPMIEFSYAYKWNVLFGSIGAEAGYGIYSNGAANKAALGNAELNLRVMRAGIRIMADNLLYEPIVAPYFIAGAYAVHYEEKQASVVFGGSTAPALYYGAGLMFQLGWLDNAAAVDAYTESGIENTFLFAEARQYAKSNVKKDPDFSTGMDFNFGLSVEF